MVQHTPDRLRRQCRRLEQLIAEARQTIAEKGPEVEALRRRQSELERGLSIAGLDSLSKLTMRNELDTVKKQLKELEKPLRKAQTALPLYENDYEISDCRRLYG
ncbi:MAG: hypothetical protein AAF732_01540 [Pseudomonadota bacterium]